MHELDLVRAFRSDVVEPDEATIGRARRKLVKSIGETIRVDRRVSYRRWVALAGVAIAIAAVIILPIVGRNRPQSLASASEALNRAAGKIEEGGGDLWPGPGEYLYVRSKSAFLNSAPEDPAWSVMRPETRETWTATDGSGRWLLVSGETVFLSERDRANWEATGSPELGATPDRTRQSTPSRKMSPSPLLDPEA